MVIIIVWQETFLAPPPTLKEHVAHTIMGHVIPAVPSL